MPLQHERVKVDPASGGWRRVCARVSRGRDAGSP